MELVSPDDKDLCEKSRMEVAKWLRDNWQQCDSRKRPVYLAKIKRERKFDGKHLAKLNERGLKLLARRSLGLKKDEADYESFLQAMQRLQARSGPALRQRSRTLNETQFAQLCQENLQDRSAKGQSKTKVKSKVMVTVHDEKSNQVAVDPLSQSRKPKALSKPSLRPFESDTPAAPRSKHRQKRTELRRTRTRLPKVTPKKYKKSKRSTSTKRSRVATTPEKSHKMKRDPFKKRKSFPDNTNDTHMVMLDRRTSSQRLVGSSNLDLPWSITSPCGSPSARRRRGKHIHAHSGVTEKELLEMYAEGQRRVDEMETETETEDYDSEIETYDYIEAEHLEIDLETPSPLEMGNVQHLQLLYQKSGNDSNRTSISSFMSSQSADVCGEDGATATTTVGEEDKSRSRHTTTVVKSIFAIEDDDEEEDSSHPKSAPKIALSPIVSGMGRFHSDEIPRHRILELAMFSMTDESSDDQSESSTVRGVQQMTQRIIETCSNRPMSAKSGSGSGTKSPLLTASTTPLAESAIEDLDEFVNCCSDEDD